MAAVADTPMTGTAVARLAAFAAATAAAPSEARLQDARLRLLDVVGISVAALGTGPAEVAHTLVRDWGGAEQATAIGLPGLQPAPSAALVNGTLAHALDFDDTHVPSILHPSASVVPAALAAAEAAHASGERLLAAIAAGNEIAIRLGNAGYEPAINNSVFFDRGLHATSICGAVGAAAAASVALDLPQVQVAHPVAIAGAKGARRREANPGGGSGQRNHSRRAAHAGVVAAQAARAGLTGPPTVLEGRFGFFRAYCGETYDEAALLDGLGERWETDACFVKPYPTNVFTHTGIDAALALRESGLRPEDVASVRVGAAGATLRTIANPREAKIRPESGYHAQFSGPFTFALALRGGSGLGVYLDDFTDEAVRDPLNLDVAARVEHHADPRAEAIFPAHFPSFVEVRTKDGRTLTHEVRANRGTAERPLTETEVRVKYDLNARALGPRAAVLADRILDAHELDDARGLLAH